LHSLFSGKQFKDLQKQGSALYDGLLLPKSIFRLNFNITPVQIPVTIRIID